MLRSVPLNGHIWNVRRLGERALLLQFRNGAHALREVHRLAEQLEKHGFEAIEDIVPAYDSIALIFKSAIADDELLILEIIKASKREALGKKDRLHTVPICYDLGKDWETILSHTQLRKEEAVELHSSASYTVAMMGFIPGFVFLEGLDEKLYCPRRPSPRKSVPAGSVGIGGSQTGIYSLESPGGWQILGRTPMSFFDHRNNPPVVLQPGDRLRFQSITEEEYMEMEHG